MRATTDRPVFLITYPKRLANSLFLFFFPPCLPTPPVSPSGDDAARPTPANFLVMKTNLGNGRSPITDSARFYQFTICSGYDAPYLSSFPSSSRVILAPKRASPYDQRPRLGISNDPKRPESNRTSSSFRVVVIAEVVRTEVRISARISSRPTGTLVEAVNSATGERDLA